MGYECYILAQLLTHFGLLSLSLSVLSEWVPALNKAGRKNVDHSITEPLAPIVLERYIHEVHHISDSACYM